MSIRAFTSDRRGAVLVEAILALPILVLITFAGVQYSQAVVFEQAVQAATDAAAREAAKLSTISIAERVLQVRIEEEIDAHLAGFHVKVGSGVRVDWYNPRTEKRVATPKSDDSLPPPPVPKIQPSETSITLQVQYTAAGLPNTLGYFGIDFNHRIFRATANARLQ